MVTMPLKNPPMRFSKRPINKCVSNNLYHTNSSGGNNHSGEQSGNDYFKYDKVKKEKRQNSRNFDGK